MAGRLRSLALSTLLLAPLMAALPAAAGPALLFEAASGKLLYGEDIDDQWRPASLTKIMTAYLTFEALKSGKLTLHTKLPYSAAAQAMPPSKIGLNIGAEILVDSALKALVIKSANDIAIVLAEAIGGSEAQFAEMMNAKARQLGMTRTHFDNANGLPSDGQVTTARDLAKLSRAVIRDFPEFAHYWSMTEMQLGRIHIGTHNNLLRHYVGADGMKTGFICDSGFNVVASATRDGVRMMAVVLGETSGNERSVRSQALLEHGFNSWGWKTAFNSETIDSAKLAPDAKDVTSIRSTVMATECGWHHKPAARVAMAHPHVKKTAGAAVAGEVKSGEVKTGSVKSPSQAPSTATTTAPKARPKPKAASAVTATAPN